MELASAAIVFHLAALLSAGLGLFALSRDWRSRVNQSFALGMLALAAENVFAGFSSDPRLLPYEVLFWQQWKTVATALLPGSWLLFSITYARDNTRSIQPVWKWAIATAFLLPLLAASALAPQFFAEAPVLTDANHWVLRLGQVGYGFYLLQLMAAVLILMNFERTIRASFGRSRWQVKFMVLGMGGYFALRTYSFSQTLLFRSVDTGISEVEAAALLVANLLVMGSIYRGRIFQVKIYLSETTLHHSITLLIVGAYLLSVGAIGWILSRFGNVQSIGFITFYIFLVLLGLAMVLLSDRLRLKIKLFVSRHFQRSPHDYRKIWLAFTQQTFSILEPKALCTALVKLIAQTFDALSVTIWLFADDRETLTFAASTHVLHQPGQSLHLGAQFPRDLLELAADSLGAIHLESATAESLIRFRDFNARAFREASARYCCPLIASDQLVGVMTIGDRVAHLPFSLEDFDLLKTVCDQMAASLLNLKLSEELQKSRQFEMLQVLSSFLLHDLKNLASSLSLTVQNLPLYFDNADFRNDAIQSLSQGVEKINAICGQLGSLKEKPRLNLERTDLSGLLQATLEILNGATRSHLIAHLEPTDPIELDREQIQKVLLNLVLNADDATAGKGEIRIACSREPGYAVLSVSDNGCGMADDFLHNSLFKPFKTTKKKGMGIGLYQCKTIVEAHGGRIEVESSEGRGSTFRVRLPAAGE